MNIFMECVFAASFVVMTSVNPLLVEETRMVLDQRNIEITVPKDVTRVVAFPDPIAALIYAVTGSTKSISGAKPSEAMKAQDGMLATMLPEMLDAKTKGVERGQISAIKKRSVLKETYGVYPWAPPSAERALLMKWAAKHNFLGKFDDIDMNKLVTFFDYDLSQAELEEILSSGLNSEKCAHL
jgi:hypothetical protein